MEAQLTALIQRTRQHHAIEHATLHLLAARYPTRRMAGYSDPGGFTLVGNLTQESVQRAVADALLRLQSGESQLALHPNCGTNLVVNGVLLTSAALLGSGGSRGDLLRRFTGALLLVLPTLLLAPLAAMRLQQYTTLATVSDRWVKAVYPLALPGVKGFRVEFETRER